MSFFAELRRRNVIRMAGLYLVGAWLLVQVAETVLPAFDIPGWVLRALILMLALGFLPALVVAWVFELTPEGLKRERDVDRSQSIVDQTARRLDVAVIVLLLGVGGLFLWREMRAPPAPVVAEAVPAAAADAAAAAATVTDKSIAVLPFADFSPGGDQAWFADGLSEEILNSLTRTPDLLVAARTSSFRYKGSELDVPQIAAALGVAYVLEGSVRSTPERIRVTAQLIRAADGFHLWSQTYDRDVADMIAIQEDLAKQIAVAMQTSMDPEALADMSEVGTQSVEAYQAYLRGVANGPENSPNTVYTNDDFEKARSLDPGFAAAHARSALYWLRHLDPTFTYVYDPRDDLPLDEMAARFNERIDLAIRTTRNEIDGIGYQAIKATREMRLRDAKALYRRFLEARPTDPIGLSEAVNVASSARDKAWLRELLAIAWPLAQTRQEFAIIYANYSYRTGDTRQAADDAMVLLKHWGSQPDMLYQIHRTLLWDGRVEEAAKVFARWKSLAGDPGERSVIPVARQACAEGRRAEVEALLATVPETDRSTRWHLNDLLGNRQAAMDVLQNYEREADTFALIGYFAYLQFDPAPFPLLKAVLAREGIEDLASRPIPFACPPEAAP
jgi:TolB-like protein